MFDSTRIAAGRPIAVLVLAAAALAWAAPAVAQDEAALRAYFEGRRVTLKLDMPGTSEGVDVHVDSTRPIDFREYGDRVRNFGVAIHAGEAVTVTLVKVKKDNIEFQLAGGGFGVFGDDTSTYVPVRVVERSKREKDLEHDIKDEDNPRRRHEMEDELRELRERRERENRRLEDERQREIARKIDIVAERRLRGGSRFNLRFANVVPAGFDAENVMAALGNYIDFANAAGAVMQPAPYMPPAPPVQAAAPPPTGDETIQPRKGMTRADAERAFGKPVEITNKRDGSMVITTIVFVRGDEKISADFVEDVLVRYSISSR